MKHCKSYYAVGDMKVRTPYTSTYTYPDITIVCGEVQFEDEKRSILTNLTVITQVLSENTEMYDRGKKFKRYREIPSLKEYILIAQEMPFIERFFKQENGNWLFSDVDGMNTSIQFHAVDCTLKLADVYEQVDFTTTEEFDE